MVAMKRCAKNSVPSNQLLVLRFNFHGEKRCRALIFPVLKFVQKYQRGNICIWASYPNSQTFRYGTKHHVKKHGIYSTAL